MPRKTHENAIICSVNPQNKANWIQGSKPIECSNSVLFLENKNIDWSKFSNPVKEKRIIGSFNVVDDDLDEDVTTSKTNPSDVNIR